jgi:selenocysteine lyase/cysteine desulfurase
LQKIREAIITQKDLLYFDYTASGQAYKPIEDKIQDILKTYANTHSEVSSNAITTSKLYDKARQDLKKTLEIDERFYILPTGTGSTGAIKKFQEILGLYIPPKTKQRYHINPSELPLVIVGPYEHHSNEISFREGLCEVIRITLNKNELIDMELFERVLENNKDREIIASFSVASNVTGVLSDYQSIYMLVKKYNGIVCLDAAASSAYMNIDCNYYDTMFLSPHKLLGGVGSCGLLVINKNLCDDSCPTFAGGGTVAYVSRTSHEFLDNFELLEDAGTPGIIQFIRASLAYKLRNEIGLKKIQEKERELKFYFGLALKQMKGIKLFCSYRQEKLPIFSLIFDNINSYDASKYLSDKFNIQTRAGCSCAGPYGHDLLGLSDGQSFDEKPGWLRISIHYTHSKEQIDKLLYAIEKTIQVLE